MRMSILNTATTEQMGYGMVSFFVCSLSMNQIVIYFSMFFCFCYHFLTFHVRKERVKKLGGIGDTDALFAKRLLSGESLYTVGEFFFCHLPITF